MFPSFLAITPAVEKALADKPKAKPPDPHRRWVATLPLATPCGACRVNGKRYRVWKIDGRSGAWGCNYAGAPSVTEKTELQQREVIARAKYGAGQQALVFWPLKIHDWQREKFGIVG